MPIKKTVLIRDEFCIETKPKPCAIVIFGASGDLTDRKLIPSFFNLFKNNLLPNSFFIIGCARSNLSDDDFRTKIRSSIKKSFRNPHKEQVDAFSQKCYYIQGDYAKPNLYEKLSKSLSKLDRKYSTNGSAIFYLAVPPKLYGVIPEHLSKTNILKKTDSDNPRTKIIIEKPFGHDLNSALELNKQLHNILSEKQIYRIDHYLGKETVQNILIFRFANSIFENIWNREYIDHIQITTAESIGVEHRAGYYDKAGALRDMFQNHMLQMLSLVAMEPPLSFAPDHVRNEKVKLLEAIKPFSPKTLNNSVVRGQYRQGIVRDIDDDKGYPGSKKDISACSYIDEEGVDKNSMTETFVAAKLMIDNWRWKGVPFYLRSGKRLPQKLSEIAIYFKRPPHSIFSPISSDELAKNLIVLNVTPKEGISINIQAKHPGPKLCMSTVNIDFNYGDIFEKDPTDAYERLLLDCMLGDQTLFIRDDDMKISWELLNPIIDEWSKNPALYPLNPYPAGSWGPEEADAIPNQENNRWRVPDNFK